MALNIIIRLTLLWLIIGAAQCAPAKKAKPLGIKCLEDKNITISENTLFLPSEHLESCLYYYLAAKNKPKSLTKSDKSLHLEPPFELMDPESFTVTIQKAQLTDLHDSESTLKDLHGQGYLYMSWFDDRLKWDQREWLVDYFVVQSEDHIWTPDAIPRNTLHTAALSIKEQMIVHSSGQVTCKLHFLAELGCDVNFEDYPADKHTCCANIDSGQYANRVNFKVTQAVGTVSKLVAHETWTVKGLWLTAPASMGKVDISSKESLPSIRMCLTAARESNTLRLELSLPVLLCVVVVNVSPLFGDLRTQSFVKMFALLLQMIALEALSAKTEVNFQGHTPTIYRFYEFSLVLNVISLLISCCMMAISRMKRTYPPSHTLFLAAVAVNEKLCCHYIDPSESRSSQYEPQVNGQDESQQNVVGPNYANDWAQIYVAFNNTASMCLISVYFFGTCLLWVF